MNETPPPLYPNRHFTDYSYRAGTGYPGSNAMYTVTYGRPQSALVSVTGNSILREVPYY